MTTTHNLFFFCGREADGGGSFSLTAGVTPALAMIRFRLGYTYQQIGDLVLSNGNQQITFRNCRLHRAVVQAGGGGARWRELQIYDRRWAWAESFGGVYGAYNLETRAPGDPRNRRSARELGQILCEAMGETGYDVSFLPSNVFPRVDWSGQNPATELEALCKAFGCFVTLTPQDRLAVRREGVGQGPTSDSRQMDFTYSEQLPVIPRSLVFEGDDILCQHDLPIVPVGLETSGSKKGQLLPIDDLSYKPSGGWAKESPDNFYGVTNKQDRDTAKKYIWRYYQVRGPVQLPLPPAQFLPKNSSGSINATSAAAVRADLKIEAGDEWRLLPIEPEQLGIFKDSETNAAMPYQLIGYFATGGAGKNNYTGSLPPEASNPDAPIASVPLAKAEHSLLYDGAFELKPEFGLVILSEPLYLLGRTSDAMSNDTHVPAKVRLRCAFPIRAKANAARLASQYWVSPGSSVAISVVKKVRDSQLGVEYGLRTKNNATTIRDNTAEFMELASAMLQQELLTYSIGTGYSSPWKGFIFDKQIDGIIRTISWDSSETGEGITSIDYNMERPEAYLSLDEMRAQRRQTALALWAEQTRKAELRRNRK